MLIIPYDDIITWCNEQMNRRISITIDSSVESRLRDLQAKKIQETNRTVSFSNIINQMLREGLKNFTY